MQEVLLHGLCCIVVRLCGPMQKVLLHGLCCMNGWLLQEIVPSGGLIMGRADISNSQLSTAISAPNLGTHRTLRP